MNKYTLVKIVGKYKYYYGTFIKLDHVYRFIRDNPGHYQIQENKITKRYVSSRIIDEVGDSNGE